MSVDDSVATGSIVRQTLGWCSSVDWAVADSAGRATSSGQVCVPTHPLILCSVGWRTRQTCSRRHLFQQMYHITSCNILHYALLTYVCFQHFVYTDLSGKVELQCVLNLLYTVFNWIIYVYFKTKSMSIYVFFRNKLLFFNFFNVIFHCSIFVFATDEGK